MIYTGQVIKISLDTNIDLTGATSPRIKYRKPNKQTGEWVATINGTDLEYTTNSGDLDVSGTWQTQVYINQSGDRYGNVFRFQVDRRI